MTVRKYDFVISLGSACQTAYQLKKRGLRQRSGPFDWFIIPCARLIEVLQNDFADFMALCNLEIQGEKNGCYTVRDTRYNTRSMHDFHLHADVGDAFADYPAFRERLDRRIGAFRRQLDTAWSILFVQTGATKQESLRLHQVLIDKRPGRRTELLVLGNGDEFDADWHVPGIRPCRAAFASNPADGAWKGDAAGWRRALAGVALKKTSLRQLQDRIVCTRPYEKSMMLYHRLVGE